MTALLDLKIGDYVGLVERPVMSSPMPKLWYMLRLHPNFELKAERQLNERGISVYVPKEKGTRKSAWNRRFLRDLPIFPGIMFVPDYDAHLNMLKYYAEGIGGFIKSGNEPMAVSLMWMARIRAFAAKMQLEPKLRKFQIGQRVRVRGGCFDMWEGEVMRVDRHHRIKVLITSIAGEVSIELDEDQVEAG